MLCDSLDSKILIKTSVHWVPEFFPWRGFEAFWCPSAVKSARKKAFGIQVYKLSLSLSKQSLSGVVL